MQVSSNTFSNQELLTDVSENKSFLDHEVMQIVELLSLRLKNNSSIEEIFKNELSKHNITYEELDDACQWASWNNEKLKEDFISYASCDLVSYFILDQLQAVLNVCSLRRLLQSRYPNEKIELNKEFPPALSRWNVTRNWCTIGGINAKEFDDLHGDRKPFTV